MAVVAGRQNHDNCHSPDDCQPGVQDLYHVCDCKRWSDGDIFAPTSLDRGEEFGGYGYHLWCCLARQEAGLYRSVAERYAVRCLTCYLNPDQDLHNQDFDKGDSTDGKAE